MRKIRVFENDANQRVDKFIQKALPTLPKSLMYKYIRNKKIKLNGKRCEISTKLVVGDEFTCYIAEEFFEVEKDNLFLKAPIDLHIIYEDENIIIMNKEKGLLAHSDEIGQIDSLVHRMKHYLYEKNEYDFENEQSFAPALCHRIDRNTQGIVIGAKNAQALRDINEAIKERCVDKFYLCVVEGIFEEKQKKILAYHQKVNQQVKIVGKPQDGFHEIETGYKVLLEKNNLSLLEIELFTGKSHQIRALMAYLKHPLYGDVKYGAKKREYLYQALCAYRVCFHDMPSSLNYLNGMEIAIDKNTIDFINII